ncbi:integrin alpha-7 isoform X1 [Xenopus laevis]|uniref:Integrin alpha-7 isoform X1 n=1 Tax=Xenopus laevis TaxID=8355 RepID=A0A8J0UGL7_XENLA|nr:integrin alpha-7 isoform X1 [Xenopus laevis]
MPAELGAPLCFSCLLLLSSIRIQAFNLDVTNTLTKDGEKGSLFGFSVALHKQLNPDPMSWLLVGAPQASALPNQNANRTGGLYGCPLTTEPKDCIRLDIDHGVDASRESKENQWLGVTVKSQGPGGKIVTCAHLYETRQRVNQLSETRDVIGRCFVLSEGLTISEDLDGGEWKFCEGRALGHEMFGFCQQGISAGFTTDNHYIMFGAPGTYNWKGELRVELFNQSALALGTYDDGPYEVAGEKSQKPEMIPVPHHSYFGFSVDSGWGVTGRNSLSFVSGAPRANHTGAVVILQRDNGSQLIPELILWGETLASSFGYSVAIEDLNNDGWMDLLVGAPNFFSRKEEIGGAVYVYMNQAGKLDKSPPIRLNGSDGSMFGIAIGSLGDINQDGFKDVAIGAPYDGNGKVYIYHGSSKGLVTKPAQILDGISVGIKTFGYSLSGGLDVDGNSYPDLLVGSLSDTVVLFRSRNVIHVLKEVIITPQNIDLENENCKHGTGICVELRACFSYIAVPANYNPRMTLKCVLEAEADRRLQGKSSRVIFLKRHSSDLEYQHTSTVELHKQSARHCTTATFQLQEGIKDKLRSIPVTLTYNIHNAHLRGQPSADLLPPLMPVLSDVERNVYTTEVNFLKEGCGEDKICQSNLQLSYTFCSRVGNTNQFVPLPVENEVPVFSLTDQNDFALKITVTNFPSDPRNPMADGDDAHEALLTAVFPDTLSYSGVRQATDSPGTSLDKEIVCISNVNASEATCELGNPMKRDAEITFYLIVSAPRITIETTDLEVKLELATISEQTNLPAVQARAMVIIELPLSVSGVATPNRLFYSGEVRGESAMRTEEDVGSPIDIEVTVSNRGKSLRTLGSAFLNLMWPHEMMNGKWLLYPMAIQLKEKEHSNRSMDCTQLKAINPLKLNTVTGAASAVQRDQTPSSASRWSLTYPEKKKDIILDCSRGTAQCVVFQCPLYSFDQQVVLKVHGRLWNSSLLEEYPSVSSLEVAVRANITIKSSIKNLVLRDATTQINVMLYSEYSVAALAGIPWWIILIAVLAGILLLALLVFILWKCGFFKRKRLQEEKLPQHHAVKIPREERPMMREEKTGTIKKKDWVTNWSEDGTVQNSS